MERKETIIIYVFYTILTINISYALPTFGDEFVHIKGHVPSEHSKAPVIHYHGPTLTNHKVIHHYHRRRRPINKVPIKETIPALENFYLSELDKHPVYNSKHNEYQSQHIEDTLVLKAQHDHHIEVPQVKIKTYKVIGEYSNDQHHQPQKEYIKTPIESVKFTKTFDDHHRHYYHPPEQIETLKEFNKTPIEAVELLESIDHDHQSAHSHPIDIKTPTQNIKFTKTFDDHHQHHYQKFEQNQPLKEFNKASIGAVELLESIDHDHHWNRHTYPLGDVNFNKAEPQNHYQKENFHTPEKEILPPKLSAHDTFEAEHIYHDYHNPQKDTFNVPKPSSVISKHHHENCETEHHLIPEIIEESLEIFTTKKAKNHNYDVSSQQYQQLQEDNQHHYYHKAPSIYHHQTPVSDISIEEHIEYETPIREHQHHQPFSQNPAADNRKYLPPLSQTENHVAANENAHHSENPHAPETYTGYDSYSAGHVQGLDNSGYNGGHAT